LVDARREFFATRGLDRQSHYIASTGIAGADANVNARLSFDSLAIAGLRPEQVSYLQAPSHLCPTHDYGVTFERATAIDYADRRQILISGTASIDATGQVVHPGDVLRQLDRTVENITALLAAAGANPGDLAVALVYLRDPADAEVIASALHDRFGAVPTVLLYAPVCRPGWLIEIEGVATVPAIRPDLPGF
jgi:enamine deaminase RidA (YjgF/YER057c/UK114 family)